MSAYKPYIATPEQMIADGYDPQEVAHAIEVVNGRERMPKPEALTDSLYAMLYSMSRKEVAATQALNDANRRRRNAPQQRYESLRRVKAKRLTQPERKAILRLLVSVVADPQAFALLASGNEQELLKYLDLKPK